MKILITGTAGFIGFHLLKKIIDQGSEIVGLDNINDYYDVNLKHGRLQASGIPRDKIEYNQLAQSSKHSNYRFIKINLEDRENIYKLFEQEKFDRVCHLAAQAGVRYSLENPHAYISSNIQGFLNLLEACRYNKIKHLVYASSSSVYGLNRDMPFSTSDNVDRPVSLYAATKKSCELMAHTYSHLFQIPTTGLRFFTVYGPWGRPDMAMFKFVKNILENKPIDIYNHGKMERDFTYIDDIIDGVIRVMDRVPKSKIPNPKSENRNKNSFLNLNLRNQETGASSQEPLASRLSPLAPYKIYNIGNGSPVNLMDFIMVVEKTLNKDANKNFLPLQKGDVLKTWADTAALEKDIGYKPSTPIKEGVKRFVEWYLQYYEVGSD